MIALQPTKPATPLKPQYQENNRFFLPIPMLKMGQGAVHSLQILYDLKHQALLNINLEEDILSFYPAWRPFVAPHSGMRS